MAPGYTGSFTDESWLACPGAHLFPSFLFLFLFSFSFFFFFRISGDDQLMIYIVRHGQTENNKAHVLQGRSDVPLNAEGIKQAKALRDRFANEGIRLDLVFTSPLIRAIQTADILTGNSNVYKILDERLIEMDYGPYEGMDLLNPAPEVKTFFSDFAHNPAPKGMEPLSDVVARLGSFLDDIKAEAQHKNVLISTHAIAMKGALEYLTPDSEGSYWSKYIGNCAVYAATISADGHILVPYEW